MLGLVMCQFLFARTCPHSTILPVFTLLPCCVATYRYKFERMLADCAVIMNFPSHSFRFQYVFVFICIILFLLYASSRFLTVSFLFYLTIRVSLLYALHAGSLLCLTLLIFSIASASIRTSLFFHVPLRTACTYVLYV